MVSVPDAGMDVSPSDTATVYKQVLYKHSGEGNTMDAIPLDVLNVLGVDDSRGKLSAAFSLDHGGHLKFRGLS